METRSTPRSDVMTVRCRNGVPLAMVVFVLTIALTACGGPVRVPVCGEVRLDGKPIANCAVVFTPVAGGAAANGATDANGRFQLATINRQDVLVGDYSVTLAKQNTSDIVNKTTGEHHLQVEWLTPPKYGRVETSGIRKNVSPQEHDFVFDLSSQ